MRRLTLRVSAAAQDDLAAIWIYTSERWNSAQADRYYFQLTDAFEALKKHPEAGKSAKSIRPNYRVLKSGQHLIFYRITESTFVDIIRIIHQKANIEDWLD